MLRWFLGLLLVQLVSAQAPHLNGLYGCSQLNNTALDQCTTNGLFSISLSNSADASFIPEVQFTSPDGVKTTFQCFLSGDVKCVIPGDDSYFNTWQSVRLRVSATGKWSNTLSPGVFIGADVPGAPCPNIDSVITSCGTGGCFSGTLLTLFGSELLDNNSDATISFSQNFFDSGFDIIPVACPVFYSYSNANIMYCNLPVIPYEYNGINLQVRVTNQWGSGVITGPLMYASPASSSSSSSTGSYPPWVPPIPNSGSSSSASFSLAFWVGPAIIGILLLAMCACVSSRRSARRRALLLASPASDYVQIQHQPIHSVQPMYTPHVATPLMPQNAYPAVHAQQYVQPQYYQPPVYQQQ